MSVYDNPASIVDLYKKHGLRACRGTAALCRNFSEEITHCCVSGIIEYDALPKGQRSRMNVLRKVYETDGDSKEDPFKLGVRAGFDGWNNKCMTKAYCRGYSVGKAMKDAVVKAGLLD